MNPIERAISYMGNASRLAEAMGCSVQAVCFWRDGKRKIDAETAMLMERVTGGQVACEELCPGVDWTYIRGSRRRIKSRAISAVTASAVVVTTIEQAA